MLACLIPYDEDDVDSDLTDDDGFTLSMPQNTRKESASTRKRDRGAATNDIRSSKSLQRGRTAFSKYL